MPLYWDGGEWEYPDAICVDCREPIDDCRCPPSYDEEDAADERYQLELDDRE